MNLNDRIYNLVKPDAIVRANKKMEKTIVAWMTKNKFKTFTLSPTVETYKGEVTEIFMVNNKLFARTENERRYMMFEFRHGPTYDILHKTIGQIAMILDNLEDFG